MNRIAIYGNRHQYGYFPELQQLLNLMEARGFSVYISDLIASHLVENSVVIPSTFQVVTQLPLEAQCVLSIGGDGTFLKTAQWVGTNEIPIMGINTGHLGFLASYRLEEMNELLTVIESNLGTIERRALLELHCDAIPEDFWPYALNEVAILKAETASMLTVHAEIDDYFLADYMADGIVVATPTGSTAYNMSVGGPILQPTLGCLVISPIAPHSLTMRPLVVAGTSHIKLHTVSRADTCRVSLDGRSFLLNCGKEDLYLSRAPFSTILLHRPDTDFPGLLRSKLFWGRR